MSNWTHREAIGAGRRLRLGIGGPSRSGKTYSSLRIATGMASAMGGKIFLIDTDNEFSLDYAEDFKFEIVDFKAPYTPERYLEAVQYCEQQGASVIVIDQMSHEQTGQGGILERQQEIEIELAAKWKTTREKAKAASWNVAKTVPHGKFVSYVTRVKQPMIFNFRCKDKVKIAKDAQGKQEWIHLGYTPICTEQFDYEMTAMVILPPNSDGFPDKELSEIRKPLRPVMHLADQLDESLGKRLAQWASGAKPEQKTKGDPAKMPAQAGATRGAVSPGPSTEHAPLQNTEHSADPLAGSLSSGGGADLVTADMVIELSDLITEARLSKEKILERAGVSSLALLHVADYTELRDSLQKRIASRRAA